MIENNKKRNIKIALTIFLGALILRMFFFQGFVVSGDSMLPGLQSGDYALVERVTYKFRDPQVGDVVVAINRDGQRVIKRVAGVPGDIVQVKGKPWNVDPNEYYLVGDNKEVSIDSRDFGPVDAWNVQGRVFGDLSWQRLQYLSF